MKRQIIARGIQCQGEQSRQSQTAHREPDRGHATVADRCPAHFLPTPSASLPSYEPLLRQPFFQPFSTGAFDDTAPPPSFDAPPLTLSARSCSVLACF